MRKYFSVASLLFAASCFATNVPITVVGSTQTQIIIAYTPTTTDFCTVNVLDPSSTIVDEMGNAFPNATNDIARTWPLFRWPTLSMGSRRTVVIGGHDEVKQSWLTSDLGWYSTALQANTVYTITVACNSGADTGSAIAMTKNVPLASYYPELMIPQVNYPEQAWPQPTIDYSVAGRKKVYKDPITGVLITRVSGPTDDLDDGFGFNPVLFTASNGVMDRLNAWTNPANAYTAAWPPSLFASTSTPNAPLFLALPTQGVNGGFDVPDYQLKLYGKGNAGTEIVEVCISEDGGQTCASGVIDINMSSAFGCQTYLTTAAACEGVPNTRQGSVENYPSGYFSGWGGGMKNSGIGVNEVANNPTGAISGVSVVGSVMTQPNGQPGFNPTRPVGTPIWLSGCTTGGPTALVHIASTDAYNQVTVQESGLNLSGCSAHEEAAGFRIILKNSGTVQLAVQIVQENSIAATPGTNAENWLCAKSKVTDISTDCDGVSHTPPLSGQLCSLYFGGPGALIYLAQDNGRVCLQSNGYGDGGTVFIPPSSAAHVDFPYSPWVSANTIGATDSSQTKVYTLTHIPNDYHEYNPGLHHSNTADRFTYALAPAPNVRAQVIASSTANPDLKKLLNSNLPFSFGLDSAVDTPTGAAMQWRFTSGGDASLCALAWTDIASGALISSTALWNQTSGGLAASACHSSPTGLLGYSLLATWGSGLRGPEKFNTTIALGGPFVSRGTGVHNPDGTFHSWTFPTITSATNATPLVLTFASATDMDYPPQVSSQSAVQATCSGATGNWTPLNGTVYLKGPSGQSQVSSTASVFLDSTYTVSAASWSSGVATLTIGAHTIPVGNNIAIYGITPTGYNVSRTAVTAVTGTTISYAVTSNPGTYTSGGKVWGFLVPVNSTTWGTFSGQSITCVTLPPVYAFTVSSATNTGVTGSAGSGFVRLSVDGTADSFRRTYPSQKLPVRDGDPIGIPGLSLSTQYYAKASCTGCTSDQIDVYTDQALTTALPFTSGIGSSQAGGGFYLAETCPDPATLDGSFRGTEDSGIGTPGSPIVRCVTLRLNTEPCSDFAYASGATSEGGSTGSYPCPSDPTNAGRSSLHNMNIGDAFFDLSHGGDNHEIFAIVKKVKTSETQIDVTLERWYGDTTRATGTAFNSAQGWPIGGNNDYACKHSAGWQPVVVAGNGTYALNITQTNPTPIVSYLTQGHDGIGPGVTPGNLTSHGEFQPGSSDSAWNIPANQVWQTFQTFTHNDWPLWNSDSTHAFTGALENYTGGLRVPGLADPVDFIWSTNWTAMNGTSGFFVNFEENEQGGNRTLTKQSGTCCTYLITTLGTPAIKTFPLIVVNGTHGYMRDISGPGSTIGDSNLNSFCYVYVNGECRSGSTVGQVYFAGKGFYDPNSCVSDNSTLAVPCAFVPPPYGGWAIQMQEHPLTTYGRGIRRLTLAFHAPMEHNDYSNWQTSSDGKKGFFATIPVNGRARRQGSENVHWWMMTLPPWPQGDNINRTTFVPMQIGVSGPSGDQIRIAFGYGENGNPTSFYCTTRQEACYTSTAATASSPFQFASETQHLLTLSGTPQFIPVPGISGRVLFYAIERTSNGVTSLGPVQVIAVP